MHHLNNLKASQILRSSFGFLVRSGLRRAPVVSLATNTGAVVPEGGPLIRLLSAMAHGGKSGRSEETNGISTATALESGTYVADY